jgi:hypothetical protein
MPIITFNIKKFLIVLPTLFATRSLLLNASVKGDLIIFNSSALYEPLGLFEPFEPFDLDLALDLELDFALVLALDLVLDFDSFFAIIY